MSAAVAPEAARAAAAGGAGGAIPVGLVEVGAADVTAALDRAGNPLLGMPCDDGTDDSAPASRLRTGTSGGAAGGAAVELVDAVAAWLGPAAERRVAASMVVLGYSARLVGPAVAVLLRDGILIDLRPEAVRYSYVAERGFRLTLTNPASGRGEAGPGPAGWRGPPEALRVAWGRTVVDDHLAVLVAAVRAVEPLHPALLWGNVASGISGALRSLATQPGDVARCRQEGTSMLDYGPLRDSGRLWTQDGQLRFRRRTCCLFYRIEGGGYCGDCPLPAMGSGGAS